MPTKPLVSALLAEGKTDRVLLPILNWLLKECAPEGVFVGRTVFIEPILMQGTPKALTKRIPRALSEQSCDLLFVHRDGDVEGNVTVQEAHLRRVKEVRAVCDVAHVPPVVCVVPVQETEAWYLLDQQALRNAVGFPKSTTPLGLPKISEIEKERDAKNSLNQALTAATGYKDARRAQFEKGERLRCFYELENTPMDYNALRALPAFGKLESELRDTLARFATP